MLGLAFFVGLMFPRGAALYLWCAGAGNRLQSKSVHRVLYAPLGFFLNVSVGGAAWMHCRYILACGLDALQVYLAAGSSQITLLLACAPLAHTTHTTHTNPPQTPVGDLLVSFTKDQDTLDEALPDTLYYCGEWARVVTHLPRCTGVTFGDYYKRQLQVLIG